MKAGFTASTIAHAALIIVAIVGLGSARPYEPDIVESISVDLVPVDAFSNIRAGSLESELVETDAPAIVQDTKPAEIVQPTGNTEENQIKPEEAQKISPAPTVNSAPAPEATAKPVPEPDPVQETLPEPDPVPADVPVADLPTEPAPVAAEPDTTLATPQTDMPAPDAVPRPAMRTAALEQARIDFKKAQDDKKKRAAEAAKQKAAEEKKKKDAEAKKLKEAKIAAEAAAKEADQVSAIINAEQSRGGVTGSGGAPTLGKATGTSATLSQSQIDALIAKIRDCLSPPLGAAEAGVEVQLHFNLDPGGGVIGTPEVTSAGPSQLEQTYSRAAVRAVMRCGPYAMASGQEVSALFRAQDLQ